MHIKEFTLPSIVTLALLGIGDTHPANAQQQIFAPASQATTDDGFVLSTDPFNYAGPSRFQNIYSSTEFAGFTTPLLITQLALRPAASQASAFSDTQNVTIDLSSTSQSITGLNATYADTVGSNNTVVYNGPLTLSTASQAGPGGTKLFDILINLQKPFLYDPNAGNLLLDIHNNSGGLTGFFDDYYAPGPIPQERQVFIDGNANAVTGHIGTFGVPTRFTVTPQQVAVPEPGPLSLLGVGMGGVALAARRRRRA